MRPIPISSVVRFIFYLPRWDPKSNGFIWLSSNLSMSCQTSHHIRHIRRTYNQILVCLVWWLPLLFPGTHEPSSGDDTWLDLGKMDLHHHTFLASIPVTNFRHSITWSTYFEEDFPLYIGLRWGYHQLGLLRIPGSPPSEVCLMLFPLCMCKI